MILEVLRLVNINTSLGPLNVSLTVITGRDVSFFTSKVLPACGVTGLEVPRERTVLLQLNRLALQSNHLSCAVILRVFNLSRSNEYEPALKALEVLGLGCAFRLPTLVVTNEYYVVANLLVKINCQNDIVRCIKLCSNLIHCRNLCRSSKHVSAHKSD